MTPRRVVLVVGPPLAGVDGVVGALRGRLPEHEVVGRDELAAERAPDAVVAVLSAIAPVTRTDWATIEHAAARTDLVVGVVSKVDAHRRWREVLEADRTLVGGWVARRRSMSWVGVAAAPDLGEPRLGDLVVVLRERLADPDLDRRNRSLSTSRPAPRPSGTGAIELRIAVARTRLHLQRVVRNRCSTMRTELRDCASAVPAGGSAGFEALVRDRATRLLTELDDEIGRAVDAVAAELGVGLGVDAHVWGGLRHEPPDLSRPPRSSRRLEGRLMAVLGVGFGLGIALASSRLLAGLTPGPSLVGLAAGSGVGVALMLWVVRARGLLHDRALLDRWVTDVAATLRWHGEAMVAERVLAAESAGADALSRRAAGRGPIRARSGREQVTDQYEW